MSVSTYTRIPPLLLVGTGAVIFLANFGLLALQLEVPRMLWPVIYSTIETWTCVIGAFLTGIALGNWLGGRIADRFPSPRTVGIVLILSGLSVIGLIGLLDFTLSSGFYKSIRIGPRIPIMAFLFCLLPAALMSMLTPLTIKLILPDVGSAGRIAGLIFALSTLGCLAGDYLTGFVLQKSFSVNGITFGVGVGLILVSIPVFFMKQVGGVSAHLPASPPRELDKSEPPDGGWDFKNNIRLAYVVVFCASFCGMSLELTGSRVLAPILGVSLFTWTGIIGVMLAGTACGNYLGGVLADRGVGPALRRFALLCGFLIGAFSAPIACRHLFEDFNPNNNEWIEYAVRAVGALIGVALVLPGFLMSKTRRGGFLVMGIVGGLLGVLIAHTALRSISKAVDLSSFSDFLAKFAEPWRFAIIHAIGFVVGAAIVLLFVWDSPKEDQKVTRSAALSCSLFIGGLMTLAVLLLLGVFNYYNPNPETGGIGFMQCGGDIVDKVVAWTFGLFFLPMLALGMISPQVIRLSVPDVQSAGRVAGSVYAWSTVGAIAGTFVTGYFLISSLGTFRVLMVLALVLTIISFFVGRLWKNNVMLYAASILCGGAIFGLFIIGYGKDRYDMETKYYAIQVTHHPDLGEQAYALTLDHLWHSIVRLDDPTWLYYKHEYVQAELLLQARSHNQETHLLVIGGGGYTFPRYVEHTTPDVNVEVVEIDPGVTQIAHDKLGLSRDTKIRTFNMDGRQFVSERATKGKYQLVMQDAVNDLSVPGHLMTKEYNDAVKSILAPNGAYLLTLIDDLQKGKLWRAAFHTMRETFQYVNIIGSHPLVAKDGSVQRGRSVYVIYGSDTPLDMNDLRWMMMRRRVETELASMPHSVFEPPVELVPQFVLGWTMERHTFPLDDDIVEALLRQQKKIILTDQYCPVDNLMADVFREQAKGRR